MFSYSDTQHYEPTLLDPSEVDMDLVTELLTTGPSQELTDIGFFDVDDFLNPPTNNNNPVIPVIVKQEPPVYSSYTSIHTKPDPFIFSPGSPSGSTFDTDEFPDELDKLEPFESEIDDLEPFESGIDSDEAFDEFSTVLNITVPVFKIEPAEDEEETDDVVEDDSDTNHLRPQLKRQGSRMRRRPRRLSPDSTDSESDPDFDPEDLEVQPPRKKVAKKEHTSDYESEEFELEKTIKRQRRPSRNPVPQQRKKGSKQKISGWIVSLLRSPETNPSVITWEDEPNGKFRVTDSARYAELWGEVKQNPNMNYEKLSRAMRYYYKNKEISMVANERLTYAFGPNMRDFRARNRADPNFECSRGEIQ